MFGLAKATSPAEFDYDNRIWPRATDPVFNLGAGADDAGIPSINRCGASGISRDPETQANLMKTLR